MNSWDEYLTTVRQLDTVRREAAAAVAAQQNAATFAEQELGGVRLRIALQRSRLTDVAGRLTRTPPVIEPFATERTAATSTVEAISTDPAPGINAALKGARATLDAADATLSVVANAAPRSGLLPDWSPVARNALTYAWYALLSLVALVAIDTLAGESPEAKVIATGLAFVVPVGAWILGWLSIGLLFGLDARGRKPRSPLLGAAICFVSIFAGFVLSVL